MPPRLGTSKPFEGLYIIRASSPKNSRFGQGLKRMSLAGHAPKAMTARAHC